MKQLITLKRYKIFLFFFIISFATLNTSCDIFEEDDDEEYSNEESDEEGSGDQNAGYDYTFNCPASGEATVPIPPGSAVCQQAYEFYARTYGCNDIDNFNAANCALCNDCQYDEYCSLCN